MQRSASKNAVSRGGRSAFGLDQKPEQDNITLKQATAYKPNERRHRPLSAPQRRPSASLASNPTWSLNGTRIDPTSGSASLALAHGSKIGDCVIDSGNQPGMGADVVQNSKSIGAEEGLKQAPFPVGPGYNQNSGFPHSGSTGSLAAAVREAVASNGMRRVASQSSLNIANRARARVRGFRSGALELEVRLRENLSAAWDTAPGITVSDIGGGIGMEVLGGGSGPSASHGPVEVEELNGSQRRRPASQIRSSTGHTSKARPASAPKVRPSSAAVAGRDAKQKSAGSGPQISDKRSGLVPGARARNTDLKAPAKDCIIVKEPTDDGLCEVRYLGVAPPRNVGYALVAHLQLQPQRPASAQVGVMRAPPSRVEQAAPGMPLAADEPEDAVPTDAARPAATAQVGGTAPSEVSDQIMDTTAPPLTSEAAHGATEEALETGQGTSHVSLTADRLQIYRDLFEDVIQRNSAYGPLLRRIKSSYDAFAREWGERSQVSRERHAPRQDVPVGAQEPRNVPSSSSWEPVEGGLAAAAVAAASKGTIVQSNGRADWLPLPNDSSGGWFADLEDDPDEVPTWRPDRPEQTETSAQRFAALKNENRTLRMAVGQLRVQVEQLQQKCSQFPATSATSKLRPSSDAEIGSMNRSSSMPPYASNWVSQFEQDFEAPDAAAGQPRRPPWAQTTYKRPANVPTLNLARLNVAMPSDDEEEPSLDGFLDFENESVDASWDEQ